MVRNLSFGKKDEKSGGGITRVLSFGKSKKKGQSDIDGGAPPDGEEDPLPGSDNKQKKTSVTGSLVRKLSFNSKKEAEHPENMQRKLSFGRKK